MTLPLHALLLLAEVACFVVALYALLAHASAGTGLEWLAGGFLSSALARLVARP